MGNRSSFEELSDVLQSDRLADHVRGIPGSRCLLDKSWPDLACDEIFAEVG